MAGCSLAGGLGTSLVKLELLVLGIGGDPLEEERKIKDIHWYINQQHTQGEFKKFLKGCYKCNQSRFSGVSNSFMIISLSSVELLRSVLFELWKKKLKC